jgi:hypothetical protein
VQCGGVALMPSVQCPLARRFCERALTIKCYMRMRMYVCVVAHCIADNNNLIVCCM